MNASYRLAFALWVIVAGSAGSATPCMASQPATPREWVEVRSSTVRLSDVFDGVSPAIDTEIAQAPMPCKDMTYDVNVLKRLADKYRLNWQPQSQTDHVVVKSMCTRITSDMLSEALARRIKDTGVNGDVEVTFDNRALEIDLPADHNPDFTLNNFSYDPVAKRFRTDIAAIGQNGTFVTPVTGRITLRQTVPVLAHRLEAGTIIGQADIDMVSVPEEHVNPSVITDMGLLLGREIRRDTDGGVILHSSDVMPPRLVTRGSLVTLKVETPVMTLTLQGKALQDGSAGDLVRVQNTQSNRIIEGKVEAQDVVRVAIAQKLAAAE